jgi:SpoVK/Ycf46/Vps4 family AAA+-type ATPase
MPGNWQLNDPLGANGTAGHQQGRHPSARTPAPSPSEEDKPVFAAEDPRRTLDDVIVPRAVRARVVSALSLLRNHHTLFLEWNLAKVDPYHRGTAINLYGPSGTGKSMCAEAITHEVGRPLINVNYAQIESRFVGQTPKNIEAAFDAARKQNAVLIFDEADAMLGSRLSQVTQSADHAVNVSRTTMLRQLDRFAGLVVFTTNFPENYDAAFVRRILAHIRFDLPDSDTRLRLWEYLIPRELPVSSDVDLSVLAAESEGLAGGDLVNALIRAATTAVSRHGAQRVVTLEDLRTEVKAARQAKSEVGKAPEGARLVSVRQVPAAELATVEDRAAGPVAEVGGSRVP